MLIVDDIIDSGNTLVECAKTLKKFGAKKIFVYATHGLFTEGVDKVRNGVDLVITADTVCREDGIEIISFDELLAEAIQRINKRRGG